MFRRFRVTTYLYQTLSHLCVSRLRWPSVNFEAASANCDKNQTALTLALDKKDAAAVEQLLELNADPNEAGRLSNGVHGVLIKPFALEISQILDYWKPVSDSVKFLELLKQHGADVDATQGEPTPLWMAAAQCRVEAVELLLKLGADPNKGEPPAKDVAKGLRRFELPKRIRETIIAGGFQRQVRFLLPQREKG